MFQDVKVVFVRHGGVFVRVSPNRRQKLNSYLTDEDEKKTQHSIIEEKHDNTNDESQETESHTITEAYQLQVTIERLQHRMYNKYEKPLKNDSIRYKVQNADEWIKATVLGRAGKATCKINTGITYKMISAKKRKV